MSIYLWWSYFSILLCAVSAVYVWVCKFRYQILTVRYGQTGRAHVLAHTWPSSLVLDTWCMYGWAWGCMVVCFVFEWEKWQLKLQRVTSEPITASFVFKMRSYPLSLAYFISFVYFVILKRISIENSLKCLHPLGMGVPRSWNFTVKLLSNYFHVHGLRATAWAFVFGRTNVSLFSSHCLNMGVCMEVHVVCVLKIPQKIYLFYVLHGVRIRWNCRFVSSCALSSLF